MKLFRLFFILILATQAQPLRATHLVGVDYRIQCLNSCTVRVHMKAYRDCSGSSSIIPSATWTLASGACGGGPVMLGPWSTQIVAEISPVCPGLVTQCSGGVLYGLQEYGSYADYEVCSVSSCTYQLSYSSCCRSSAITSLVSPGSVDLYVSNLVSFPGAGCNASPAFRLPPQLVACAGQASSFDYGADDPDGDSLVYSLVNCRQAGGAPVTYNAGFSATAPFGSSWGVNLDAATGRLSLTPSPGNMETAVICIQISEYRGGILVGTTTRDVQVSTLNCGANSVPNFGAVNLLTMGNSMAGNVITVNTASLDFEIGATDANAGQIISLSWSMNIAGATFAEVGNPAVSNLITGTAPNGHFSWPSVTPGQYTVVFYATDDNCPFVGQNHFSVLLVVNGPPCTPLLTTTVTPIPCSTYDFNATVSCGLTPPISWNWDIGGILTGTTQNFTAYGLAPGAYAWTVTATDVNGVVATGGGTLVVNFVPPVPAALITSTGAADRCANTCQTLMVSAPYANYSWNNGANTQNIIVCPPGGSGWYMVTVTDVNGCIFYDSLLVNEVLPDIYGSVTTSTGAALVNQEVYLIRHDTTGGGTLTLIDTDTTNNSGEYYFCNITDTLVYVKAGPDSAAYPNEMPTYASSALLWAGATGYSNASFPLPLSFSTMAGGNPGGPGFIGGLISLGANKMNTDPGDPVSDLPLLLVDDVSGSLIDWVVTGSNGEVTFADLPTGTYRILADKPGISHAADSVPVITLTSLQASQSGLQFVLHRHWLELMAPAQVQATMQGCLELYPVPVENELHIRFCNPEENLLSIHFVNALGQRFDAAVVLAPGMYLVEIVSDKGQYQRRIVVGR